MFPAEGDNTRSCTAFPARPICFQARSTSPTVRVVGCATSVGVTATVVSVGAAGWAVSVGAGLVVVASGAAVGVGAAAGLHAVVATAMSASSKHRNILCLDFGDIGLHLC